MYKINFKKIRIIISKKNKYILIYIKKINK